VWHDWLQQFCLMNNLVHAQKYSYDAKTFLKCFSRLFILFLLYMCRRLEQKWNKWFLKTIIVLNGFFSSVTDSADFDGYSDNYHITVSLCVSQACCSACKSHGSVIKTMDCHPFTHIYVPCCLMSLNNNWNLFS